MLKGAGSCPSAGRADRRGAAAYRHGVALPQPRCTVWWAAPIAPEEAPELVGLLDAHERARLDRLRRPADRARYLAAHALARLVLAGGTHTAAATLAFDRTCRCGEQHGKPLLPGAPGFSLSHAGLLVGVAVHRDGAVGLDVEQVRDVADLAAVAAHVHSPVERSRDGSADLHTFFRTWTRKEALVKATGDGLAAPMSAITLAAGGAVVEQWAGARAPDGPLWLHDLAPAPGHVAAVAGPGDGPPEIVEARGDAVLRG
jgi:4'-phosphopantetheinyl transferase